MIKERFESIPHHIPAKQTASEHDSVIPKKVYMSWKTRDIPEHMYKTIMKNIENNPDFDFYIYDDNECREFIVANYDAETVAAFDALKPGAYKSDLWRYCILYKLGGIYMDIKFEILVPLNTLTSEGKNVFIKDFQGQDVYQAIMITKPGEPLFLECIETIKTHVKTKFYGNHPLEPTGPRLIGGIIYKNGLQSAVTLTLKEEKTEKDPKQVHIYEINNPERTLFKSYEDYRIDQEEVFKNSNTKYYGDLWHGRDIYN